MNSENFITHNNDATIVTTIKANYTISFHGENGVVGKLDFNGPHMTFEGEADESAQVFLDVLNNLFSKRIEQARQEAFAEAVALIQIHAAPGAKLP